MNWIYEIHFQNVHQNWRAVLAFVVVSKFIIIIYDDTIDSMCLPTEFSFILFWF